LQKAHQSKVKFGLFMMSLTFSQLVLLSLQNFLKINLTILLTLRLNKNQ